MVFGMTIIIEKSFQCQILSEFIFVKNIFDINRISHFQRFTIIKIFIRDLSKFFVISLNRPLVDP